MPMPQRLDTMRASDSTKVHICVLCLVLFVLHIVGYGRPTGGWCAKSLQFSWV